MFHFSLFLLCFHVVIVCSVVVFVFIHFIFCLCHFRFVSFLFIIPFRFSFVHLVSISFVSISVLFVSFLFCLFYFCFVSFIYVSFLFCVCCIVLCFICFCEMLLLLANPPFVTTNRLRPTRHRRFSELGSIYRRLASIPFFSAEVDATELTLGRDKFERSRKSLARSRCFPL